MRHLTPEIKIFAIIIFIILVVAGCTPAESVPQVSRTDCPTYLVNTPESKGNTPKLIIILVKEDPSYRDYSYQAFDLLTDILPEVIEPGDRVIMLSTEHFTIENSVFLDAEVSFIEKPAISNSPTPPPTIGVLPSPTVTPEGDYMRAVATQNAIRYIQNTQTYATQAAFEYACAKEFWNRDNQELWEQWEAARQLAIASFMESFESGINNNKINGFTSTGGQMFEALHIASLILNSECPKYNRCDLVIFSDLYDFRDYRPQDIDIQLSNLDIAVMLPNCEYLPQCQQKITFWTDNFTTYGAHSSQFALEKEIKQTLLDYLRR